MKHVFETFLDPLVIVYGEPKTTDVNKFLNEYAKLLAEYDEDELEAAKVHIMKTQKGKFFPTPGECLAACTAAQQLEGPRWPDRMHQRIKEATEGVVLKALSRRVEARRRGYYPETITNLMNAIDARYAELGEESPIVDLTKRMTGEAAE